jgi:hypothetical protein
MTMHPAVPASMVFQENSPLMYAGKSTLRGLGLRRRGDSVRVVGLFAVVVGRWVGYGFCWGGKGGHGRRYTFYRAFRLYRGLFWKEVFCFLKGVLRCCFLRIPLGRGGVRTWITTRRR